MKILHINTFDRGGAANSCIRLHKGLLAEGVDSTLLLLNKTDHTIPASEQFAPLMAKLNKQDRIKRKVKRVLKELNLYKENIVEKEAYLYKRPEGFELFSFPDTPFDITSQRIYQEADIVNIHWSTGFLDYTSFFQKNTKKLVWTLHDMNPFTGGCHYSDGCGKFQVDCHQCPQLEGTINPDYSNHILRDKQKALGSSTHMTIVAPSIWLTEVSRSSKLFKNYPHNTIPYGLDSTVYQPRNKAYSRQLLGLPTDKKIFLFVSDYVINRRKGYRYLVQAIEQLQDRQDIVICAVGRKSGLETNSVKVFELGVIADERMMSAAYSAADCFVIPSIEDNLPNTVLESLMCGTPVIGFPIGGVKDMIISARNGILCDHLEKQALSKAILTFLACQQDFNSDQIRQMAITRYDLNIQAKAYIKLYRQLLTSK